MPHSPFMLFRSLCAISLLAAFSLPVLAAPMNGYSNNAPLQNYSNPSSGPNGTMNGTMGNMPPIKVEGGGLNSRTAAEESATEQPQSPEANIQGTPESMGGTSDESILRPFGSALFQGKFRNMTQASFQENYVITQGDMINVQFWGSIQKSLELVVDPRGNLFIPDVGPIRVAGLKQSDLNPMVQKMVYQVYKSNVGVYASLNSARPVDVFVSGFVRQPGIYSGLASHSILSFLDKAGGILPEQGSYLDIEVLRNGTRIASLNLYDFLLYGKQPSVYLHQGDVVVVRNRQSRVLVTGNVRNPAVFEFRGRNLPAQELILLAQPQPGVNWVKRSRVAPETEQMVVDVLTMAQFNATTIQPDDQISFHRDLTASQVSIEFQGSYEGASQVTLPKGATLADAIAQISPSPIADMNAVRLYRPSVALRKKQMLDALLEDFRKKFVMQPALSSELLQAKSTQYANIEKFIERARQASPDGLVAYDSREDWSKIPLHEEDIIFIPTKDNVVKVLGEVQSPSTTSYKPGMKVKEYVKRAAGFTQSADKRRIYVIHNNGQLDVVDTGYVPQPDDEIVIPTKVQLNGWIFAKDVAEMLFKIATVARIFTLD
jgi:protein involved in polysaccharide export with SLBB domain